MRELLERYTTDKQGLERFYQLTWSERRFVRLTTFFTEWLNTADSCDFGELDVNGQVDCLLLKNDCRRELDELAFHKGRREGLAEWIPFGPTITRLEEARWLIEAVDPVETAGTVDKLASTVKSLIKKFENALDAKAVDELPSKTLALRASRALAELKETFDHWFKYYDGYKPLFSWWVRKPYEAATKALSDYEKLMKERIAEQKGEPEDPLVGDPVGEKRLLLDLDREFIGYSPDELIRIAEKEVEWCEKECARAASDMGVAGWKEALEKTKQGCVPPGEQDELGAFLGREAQEYVTSRELVTVEPLCAETWKIEMIDAETQLRSPFLLYGGQKMLVSYPLDTMEHEARLMSMRANNRHFTRAVVHHELIPGHHLQLYMHRRYSTHRMAFQSVFFVEGWALHWEFLLWKLGFPQSPEDRVGMLFWRLHRAARIVVSLGFHLGKMTPDEMVDYLVERVGHERNSARAEVRRFIGEDYPPLYQIAYMIGALQLHTLYVEWVESGKMTPKEFHDKVLKINGIPFDLVKAIFDGGGLSKDHKATWRFASL